MKIRNTVTKLSTITMMVALVAAGLLGGSSLQQSVKAQTGDGSVRFVSYAHIGIVHGQRIRLSVANTAESTGTLSFQYYLAHGTNSSGSVPLYESEMIKVPAGEFRFSDVSRADLITEGETETGRAQMMVKITLIAPAGSKPEHFPSSLEVIPDDTQARTGIHYHNGSEYMVKVVYQPPVDSTWMATDFSTPIGTIPGERLRYSFFYPNEEGGQPVQVQAYIYDSYGNLLKATDPAVLRPGDGHFFDINRDDLRLPGEEPTGRLQVRPSIRASFMDGSVRPVRLSVGMEVIDNRTGSTSGGNYFTGSVTVSGDG